MADFPAALDAALRAWYAPAAGVRSPIDSPRGLNARLTALEKEHGSGAAAARAAGVPARTWRAWTTSADTRRTPGPANQVKVALAYAKMLADRGDRRRAPRKMNITADVTAWDDSRQTYYLNKTRRRTFRADQLKGLGGIVRAWRAGGATEAAEAALNAINAAYGRYFTFEGDNVDVDLS